MAERKRFNPDLYRTMHGEMSKASPGKELRGDYDEFICSCGGTRATAIKCLKGTGGDTSELAEKKLKCAREILSDPRIILYSF